MKDFYKTLNIDNNSTQDEIKSSYKKLALKYHPDRGGNENKFKELTEAYSILSDKQKKKEYDMFGISDSDNIDFGNMNDIINNMFNFTDNDINEMLNDFQIPDLSNIKPKIFVNIHKIPMPMHNNNLKNTNEDLLNNITSLLDNFTFDTLFQQEKNIKNTQNNNLQKIPEYDNIEIKIDLDDIINSKKKQIKYKIKDLCSSCNNVKNIIKCLTCNGINPNCYSCGGQGICNLNTKCMKCDNGLIMKDVNINIMIPKGVPDNHILIIKNKGSYNKNTKNYNHIKLKCVYNLQKNIQIYGNNIFLNVNITLKELLCGFKKEIEFGSSKININMENYFDPSDSLTYNNMGIPMYKKPETIGDLVVKFNIIYPSSKTDLHRFKLIFKKIFK
jgi:DnaJ-class molecular chaperone